MSNLPIYEMLAQTFATEGVDAVFNVTDFSQLPSLLRDYEAGDTADIWNFPISDQVTSPTMRRVKTKGHGVM